MVSVLLQKAHQEQYSSNKMITNKYYNEVNVNH